MRIMIMAMVLMFALGMAVWLILYANYTKLLWDVRNSEYKTPLIKMIIRKYGDCKKLDIDVRNVNAFVEKSIAGYEFCGLPHVVLEKLAKSMEYLVVMLAVLSALAFKERPDEVYMCVALGALSTMALHLCRKIADIEGAQRSIVVELVDYLENSGGLPFVSAKEVFPRKLSGKAYVDFVKLNRCFDKICATRRAGGDIAKM